MIPTALHAQLEILLEQLDAKIADVEGRLEAAVRERYRRVAGARFLCFTR